MVLGAWQSRLQSPGASVDLADFRACPPGGTLGPLDVGLNGLKLWTFLCGTSGCCRPSGGLPEASSATSANVMNLKSNAAFFRPLLS